MRFKLLSILFLFCGGLSFAQLQTNPVPLINDLNPSAPGYFPQQSGAKQGNCGVDTLYYPYYKSSAFYAVSLNASTSASAFAQWYPSPQSITINGFDFFAYQSDGTNASVTITCNIYIATGDSLPQGSPIRSTTISIDSTFGGGLLSSLRKHISFANAVTLSVPYVITLETQSSVNVSVICNNYVSGDGRAEWLSSGRIQNNWRHGYQINIGSYSMNADFILMPTVSYSLVSDFSVLGCNEGNTLFNFPSNSSAVLQNRFYNRYAYYGLPQYGFQWDYGDTSGSPYAINGSHTYKNRMPYWVTLRDTMYGWTTGCADYSTKLVPYRPLPPALSNDGPKCNGDSIQLISDSIAGTSYSWNGPDSFTSKIQNPTLYLVDTGMTGKYSVTVKYANCVSDSAFTYVTVNQTPQIDRLENDGPKCVADSVVFSAATKSPNVRYHWTGPNGFTDSTNGFTFYSLDTFDVGTYFLFIEDAFCRSETDSTSLYTYPPPQIPVLSSLVGDSLCQSDSVYLQGLSVIGATFDWIGPNGFKSSKAKPAFIGNDTLQSGWYSSRVLIGSCISDRDSFKLTVLRSPIIQAIEGSDTSTEHLIKTYRSPKDYRDGFLWTCLGGTILSMDSLSGDIQVEWGDSGLGMLIVYSMSPDGCYGGTEKLEVEILAEPPPPDNTSLDFQKFHELKIVPNPAQWAIRLLLANQAEVIRVELWTMEGKQVLEYHDGNASDISISSLSNGLYLVKAYGSSGEIFIGRLQVLK